MKFVICMIGMIFSIVLWLILSYAFRMYFPWNKSKAIEYAQTYYNQNYTKPITYSHCRIYRAEGVTQPQPIYKYYVYFRLEEEPECVFRIELDYDYENGECSFAGDNYLYETMNCRILSDSGIQKFYGNELFIKAYYSTELIEGEQTTLSEIKIRNEEPIIVDIFLQAHSLTEEQVETEAERLYSCSKCLADNGYKLKKLVYGKAEDLRPGWPQIELPEHMTIDIAEKLLSKALKERE